MKVGMLTSWRVPCGIYQYSSRLVEAFNWIDPEGLEVHVLAGRADEHRSVPEEYNPAGPIRIHDVAKIGMWRDDGVYDLDVDAIMGLDLDVVHVQYENMLFTQPHLQALMSEFTGVRAITYHDKCIRGDFPHGIFNLHFSHRWDVGPPNVECIPFGIEDRPPVIRTFGLGRTRSDFIKAICDRHGWIFETCASHEPIHGGGQQWQTHEDLIAWLRGADAIVLWYDDVDMAGESQAARTAMAARRPVFVNDVTWFSDLPRRTLNLTKVQTLDDLESALRATLNDGYTVDNSWDHVARLLVDRYAVS